MGFERAIWREIVWGLLSRRLAHYRAQRALLLPHVLGLQDKDQLGVLHPIRHKEEGKGNCQCFGEGT